MSWVPPNGGNESSTSVTGIFPNASWTMPKFRPAPRPSALDPVSTTLIDAGERGEGYDAPDELLHVEVADEVPGVGLERVDSVRQLRARVGAEVERHRCSTGCTPGSSSGTDWPGSSRRRSRRCTEPAAPASVVSEPTNDSPLLEPPGKTWFMFSAGCGRRSGGSCTRRRLSRWIAELRHGAVADVDTDGRAVPGTSRRRCCRSSSRQARSCPRRRPGTGSFSSRSKGAPIGGARLTKVFCEDCRGGQFATVSASLEASSSAAVTIVPASSTVVSPAMLPELLVSPGSPDGPMDPPARTRIRPAAARRVRKTASSSQSDRRRATKPTASDESSCRGTPGDRARSGAGTGPRTAPNLLRASGNSGVPKGYPGGPTWADRGRRRAGRRGARKKHDGFAIFLRVWRREDVRTMGTR